MYSFLFDWLVDALNHSLACKDAVKSNVFIAVLDIFGFEAFQENSFEQLLINYCNEKLLAHFNRYIFVMEQEEYQREDISFDFCDFKDNSATIGMLEKSPTGLLALMDEEIQIPKGSDEKLLEKIFSNHIKKDLLTRAMARKEKHSQVKFVVTHFAGEVAYDIRGFLEKNKDTLPASFMEIGATSTNPFIAELFKVKAEKGWIDDGGWMIDEG
jgi:myosin V